MKRTRVEIACGFVAMFIVISLVLSGLLLTKGQYVPRVSDYSSYEIAVQPPSSDYVYPLANYSLVRSGVVVDLFDRVGVASFASGIEFYDGMTNLSHKDQYGYLEIHEVPSSVIEYRSYVNNSLKFELSQGTGAIKSGGAVIVGSEDASGEFVMLGSSTSTITGSDVFFDVPAGSGVIFRSDTSQDHMVGSAVADEVVAAEMYLSEYNKWTIAEDVVSFDEVEMLTVAASSKSVDVQVLGSVENKAVVLHVSQPYLDYNSVDEIMVKLDGEKVKQGQGISETLWSPEDEASYYAVKTDTGFDVIVYIPQYSDSVITISSAETEFGVDGLATLLAAIGIVGVAVVALIKTD